MTLVEDVNLDRALEHVSCALSDLRAALLFLHGSGREEDLKRASEDVAALRRWVEEEKREKGE